MNRTILRSLAAVLAGVFFLAAAAPAEAQVVTTGIVLGVDPEKGIVTVRADQNNRAMNFVNMQKAPISRASGKPAKLEDVWTGMRVSISYAQRGGRWSVGRLSIPDPPRLPASQDWIWLLTPGECRALYTPRSNDITIKPPRRALFENDITLRNDNR